MTFSLHWPAVSGHAEQIEMLRRAASRNRLAHTYLFAGTRGIGKHHLAKSFAQSLLCDQFNSSELKPCDACKSCLLFKAQNHPDFLTVSKPAGKMEIPVELFAGSKEDKSKPGLLIELNLRPQRSQKRVAIIDDADLMNDAGANALLKTLEEPPPYAIIILITSQLDRVISTIRSRSQIICFGDLSSGEIVEILTRDSIIPTTNVQLDHRLSTGHSVAHVLEQQQELYQQVHALLEQKLFSREPDVVSLYKTLLELIQSAGGDASTQRDILRGIIQQMIDQCRLRVYIDIDLDSPSIVLQETILNWIERLIKAEMDLESAMAVPLCLESLCYDLANLKRRQILQRS